MAVAKRPTVKAGRPTAEQAAALGQHIVRIARDLLYQHGYGAMTMDAVAAKAGISKGTLYSRFRTKADLFAAFFLDQTQRWTASDHKLVEPFSGDLAQCLTDRVDAFAAAGLSADSVNLARLIYAESGRFPELARIHYDGGIMVAVRILAADLAAADGRDGAGESYVTDAHLLHDMITGYVLSQILQGRAGLVTAKERGDWARHAVSIFVAGHARRD